MSIFAVVAALSGCGGDAGVYNGKVDGPGTLGATPGGAQDIAYARALIHAGSIPPADAITVEGLLSEHDLPVMGEPCEDLICVRPVAGIAPDLATGRDEMWVHLGMSSGLGPDFQRPPLDLVVVVDKSSSMDIDMHETNDAVADILGQIQPEDRVAVVTFDDAVRTILPPVRGADLDLAAAQATVRGTHAAGGADLMAGLRRGYELAQDMGSDDERMTRVIVLSCGYPTVGDTGTDAFVTLVEQGSDDGIGLTFLGVLLSFDYRLAQRLSAIRGGNYFYMEDLEHLEKLFEEEFDMIVTPLAYDLNVKLGVDPDQWRIGRIYGLGADAGSQEAGFEVSTAFASRRGGAIVARMTPTVAAPTDAVAHVSLSYEPESAHGWTSGVSSDAIASSSADLPAAGVRKSVALVNMAERMRAAIEANDSVILVDLHEYLRAEAEALGDPALEAEVELIEKLIRLF